MTRKLALVTGAAVRVGAAIASKIASDFDLVLCAGRSSLAGQSAVLKINADLKAPAEIDRIVREVKALGRPLDLVVHNAGLWQKVPFGEISRADYRAMLGVNLDAPFFLTQGLLPMLAEDAAIVFVADILADRCPPGYAHYMASKAGLVALTKGLAVELAPRRVNAVAPGTVAFPPDMDQEVRDRILERVPLGREGTPEDVARTVRFIASSPFLSGQVIAVDGGRDAVH